MLRLLEISDSASLHIVQATFDLMGHDGAAPSVFNGRHVHTEFFVWSLSPCPTVVITPL